MRTYFLISILALGIAARADTKIPLFSFDDTQAQVWSWTGPLVGSLTLSEAKALDGKSSLAIALSGSAEAATQAYIKVSSGLEKVAAGAAVEFHLWIPEDSGFTGFEPYSSDANGGWAGTYTSEFKPGEWNTFVARIGCNAALPLKEIGLYLFAAGATRATAYLDAVAATPPPAPPKPRKEPKLRVLREIP